MDQAAQLRKLAKLYQSQAKPSTLPNSLGLRSVAITSGKGGVGKSNIALNLALALCLKGAKVLLVDADVGLANLDVLLGIQVRHTLEDALQGRCSMKQVLTEGPHGLLKLLPSRSGVAALGEMETADQQRLFSQLATLEEVFDYLLIDTGAGVSSLVMGFNAAASEVLVVATPEPTSLADSYALIKLLHQRNMPQYIYVVSNQVQSPQEAMKVHQRLNTVSLEYLKREVGFLGGIPRDNNLLKAVRQRQPLLLYKPQSPAALAIQQLAVQLHTPNKSSPWLGAAPPSPKERSNTSFWGRLRLNLATQK